MLEMHYDNPDMREITDASGVVLDVTPSLREFEAGACVRVMGSLLCRSKYSCSRTVRKCLWNRTSIYHRWLRNRTSVSGRTLVPS